MKYLIVGIGNIGNEYHNTRHNIGFTILDALAKASNVVFEDRRYGMVCQIRHRGRTLVLLKPSTFVNLSGKAVNYWLKKEKVPVEKILVVLDDIALPYGNQRLRAKGGDGGHNGLINIISTLGTQNFARLRFGIGDGFHPGQKVDYVLGRFTGDEYSKLPEHLIRSNEIIKGFTIHGIERAMNLFNTKNDTQE